MSVAWLLGDICSASAEDIQTKLQVKQTSARYKCHVSFRRCLSCEHDCDGVSFINSFIRTSNIFHCFTSVTFSMINVLWFSLQEVFDAYVCEKEIARSLVLEVKEVHCKIGNKRFVFQLDGT